MQSRLAFRAPNPNGNPNNNGIDEETVECIKVVSAPADSAEATIMHSTVSSSIPLLKECFYINIIK